MYIQCELNTADATSITQKLIKHLVDEHKLHVLDVHNIHPLYVHNKPLFHLLIDQPVIHIHFQLINVRLIFK